MGNLNSLRDWGHARDYIEMQWLMLQKEKPKDYVIATGEQHTVREFILMSASHLGIQLEFEGEGDEEIGIVKNVIGNKAPHVSNGDKIIRVDARYYRPAEVDSLLGDSNLAKKN